MEIGPKIRRIRADLRFDTSKIDPRKIAEEVIAYYRKIKKE
jgi:hypothetical protein